MAEAQKPARDATWDIARGIGMMLVIYGHLLEPIYPANKALGQPLMELAAVQWQTIYTFHMMLFFLVSGAVNLKLPKKAWPDALRGSLRSVGAGVGGANNRRGLRNVIRLRARSHALGLGRRGLCR